MYDAAPLTTVEGISAHVGEAIELTEEVRLAESMAAAASAHVRHYGRAWPDPDKAPAIARTIATAAAARGYMNPSGFLDERSDSVTLKRADAYAADTQLTPQEIKMLQEVTGGATVTSIRLTLGEDRFVPRSRSPFGYVRRDPAEGVPIDSGVHTPFPFYRRRR